MGKPPKVHVRWWDAASNSQGWAPVQGYTHGTGLMAVETLGFLIKKSRKEVQVALSLDEAGKVSEAIAIPRACVRSIKRVR